MADSALVTELLGEVIDFFGRGLEVLFLTAGLTEGFQSLVFGEWYR